MSTCPCDYLEKQNKFSREKRVVFDDSFDETTQTAKHDYYIDGDKQNIKSVTTIIHGQFEEFDAPAIIKKILKNKKHQTDSTYKYYKMSEKEILDMWEENRDDAASRGTLMHLNIEKFYNKYPFEDTSVEFKQFMSFHEDYQGELTAFRTELVVFNQYYRIAGSIDMIFKDTSGKYWIYDWKRSKEFKFENRWQHGKGELSHIDDCNIMHYSLQLNMYRYILEKDYGMTVAGMCLVRCHPNIEDYDRVQVDVMHDEIEMILERREMELYPEKKKEILARIYERNHKPVRCMLTDSDSDSE